MTYLLRNVIIVAGLLFIWQMIVTLGHVPDYLLASPAEVAMAFYQQGNLLFIHAAYTITEILLGFILGVMFGCFSGFMVAFFRPLKLWFLPIMIVSQAIPIFAIAPLLVVWLGYGLASKIAITILMIFFPVASSFHDGLQKTPQAWLDLASIMRARKWRVFYFIRLPSALPSLASGIRIAAVIAPMGAIIGEWVGSSHGLGYLMLNANAHLQIDMMFAALIVIMMLALVLYFGVDRVLSAVIRW